MLRRIIRALQIACEHHGLREEVCKFAGVMEATHAMAAGQKKDTMVTLTVTKQELGVFLSYMIQLHNSKLSLLTRARIGLVTLLIDDKLLMPRNPETGEYQNLADFAGQQFAQAKSSKDDRRIQTNL
jgi:hypothetical protein